MTDKPQTSHPLRCLCSREPLLATYGLDRDGEPYVHVKVYKQKRIYGNIVLTGGGTIRMQCRECFRWYRVVIVGQEVALERLDNISPERPAESTLIGGGPAKNGPSKVGGQDE